jgi:hypothetical protein
VREEGAGGGFGDVAGAGPLMPIASTAGACHRPVRSASPEKERRRVGGHYSTPLRLGSAGPDESAKPSSILRAGGQQNVSREARAHVADWKAAYQRPRHLRYKLIPKSCPTRVGRLKAATSRAVSSSPKPAEMPSMRWTLLTGERVAARRQPIAATRNERVSSMLPRTPFGISSCNGNAAGSAGRKKSSRSMPYRRRCVRRWELFDLASH